VREQLEEVTAQASALVALKSPAGKRLAETEFKTFAWASRRKSIAAGWQSFGNDNDNG
jgi:hypothetical protein